MAEPGFTPGVSNSKPSALLQAEQLDQEKQSNPSTKWKAVKGGQVGTPQKSDSVVLAIPEMVRIRESVCRLRARNLSARTLA